MTDAISTTKFLPKEEMLEQARKKCHLVIGIPKETVQFEERILLTPQAVEFLTACGHKVIIEAGAGAGANYEDREYSEAGGVIIADKETVYRSDILLKMAPFSSNEIELLKENQTIISSLHINTQSRENIQRLMDKKVKAIGVEYIHDDHGYYPVVSSMSEISGISAILVAAEYFSKERNGKGVLLAGITGITPAEVVILGSGTAAYYATRAALGIGAAVKIFDNSVNNLRKFEMQIGQPVFTSILYPKVIQKALQSADVVIGAMELPNIHINLISEEMVKTMKKGSIIVDLNTDVGSCIETSLPTNLGNPVYEKYNVLHYCVPNIASRVSRSASIALSNVISPILQAIGNSGGIAPHFREETGIRNGTYIYNGILTNEQIGKRFGIAWKDINLLMAAF